MFSGPNCPGCINAKQWLDANGVAYQVQDISNPQVAQYLVQATGQRTIPQFFHNGQWLSGGFRQVQQLRQQGAL